MMRSSLQLRVDSNLPGRPGRRRRPTNAARRRPQRPELEALEGRIALSTILPGSSHGPARAMAAHVNPAVRHHAASPPWAQSSAVMPAPHSEITPSGNVVAYATDGAISEEFQKVTGGWKLVTWKGNALNNLFPDLGVLVEQRFGPDGTLTETIWNADDHVSPGTPELASVLVQENQIVLSLYHMAGYPIYYGLESASSRDATVTWTFTRTTAGGAGALLQYHVADKDTTWAADWEDPTVYPKYGWGSSGWLEYYPYDHDVPVPSAPAGLMAHVNQVAVYALSGNTPVPVPPGVTKTSGPVDGQPADTYWTPGHKTSVTFVYSGPARRTLLEQIYGTTTAAGQWVATADTTKAGITVGGFISQALTYDKRGGNLKSSSTTFTAADEKVATLNGTWTSGTALDNATGVETGGRYLGFDSVAIQIQNGKAITRTGVLHEVSVAPYARDTFNSKGTIVTKRETFASSSMTGTVVQKWTDPEQSGLEKLSPARSGLTTGPAPGAVPWRRLTPPPRSRLTIAWNRTDSQINNDAFNYTWNVPNGESGYNLMKFSAQFKKPVHFDFDHYRLTSKTYNWYQKWVYDRTTQEWGWIYREYGDTGVQYEANSDPSGQAVDTYPVMDNYWCIA